MLVLIHQRKIETYILDIFFIEFDNSSIFKSNNFLLLISHCQTVITFQPSFLRSMMFLRSLSLFLPIFSIQNSTLVVGKAPFLQLCPCQKQPFIKITVLYFAKTISGVPDNVFTFFLYLNPFK